MGKINTFIDKHPDEAIFGAAGALFFFGFLAGKRRKKPAVMNFYVSVPPNHI